MYRWKNAALELLLVHAGGPFWARKDEGAWTIPKGEFDPETEEPLAAARREFEEEIGLKPNGQFLELTPIKQKGGKVVHAWAVEGDCDPSQIKSNSFRMEWPPKSGKLMEFPEVDRAGWFSPADAKKKINSAQAPFIDELTAKLGRP